MSALKFNGIRIFLGISLMLMAAAYCMAQTITGTVSGTVTDSSGSIIVGATVTLVSNQNAASRTAVSNDEGRFSFTAVLPGAYTVKVEQKGFQTLLRTNNNLSANENLALGDLALTAGNVSETVTVMSEGAMVERSSSDLSARLTADQLALISTKGRDVTSLLRLLPGTSN